jgi:Schlafen, AlbA_2
MKEPWEWEEEDILDLICDEVQESLTLDYKACDALDKSDRKKDEVSKDVSAFANSAGGTIIYGVIEEDHRPETIDTGYDPDAITKEWLGQVIRSKTHPPLADFRIKQVSIESMRPGKVIYVVHVPQAKRPYQAADLRYHKRYEYEAVRMYDHEIEDVRRRGESPDLRIELFFSSPSVPVVFNEGQGISVPVELGACLLNDAPTPAEYASIQLFANASLGLTVTSAEGTTKPGFMEVGTQRYPAQIVQIIHSIPAKVPIWHGVRWNLLATPATITFPRGDGVFMIGWQISAPRMTERQDIRAIVVENGSARITEAPAGL